MCDCGCEGISQTSVNKTLGFPRRSVKWCRYACKRKAASYLVSHVIDISTQPAKVTVCVSMLCEYAVCVSECVLSAVCEYALWFKKGTDDSTGMCTHLKH